MIDINTLSKSFGEKIALDNVTFSIQKREIVGVVGPNGSGKTTLLNILMGMIHPSSGSFKINEGVKLDMSVSRKGFFNDMTVLNNILMYTRLNGVQDDHVRHTMKEFLIDYDQMIYKELSAGMKQRVSLLLPFASSNNLILLDEPTNHLDIDSIFKLRDTIIERRNAKFHSFIITSHILSDLEKICDRIFFLKAGKLIRTAITAEILSEYGNLEDAYINIMQ